MDKMLEVKIFNIECFFATREKATEIARRALSIPGRESEDVLKSY